MRLMASLVLVLVSLLGLAQGVLAEGTPAANS